MTHRAKDRLTGDLRLVDRLDASDIVQEADIEAYERLDDYLVRRPMPFRLLFKKTAMQGLSKAHRRHIDAVRRSLEREPCALVTVGRLRRPPPQPGVT